MAGQKDKPVKIRSFNCDRKYGVAAKTVKEVITKSCKLLQLPLAGAHVCLYSDGTEVTEEYFKTLPDNVDLVLLTRDQTWDGVAFDIVRLLSTGRHTDSLIKAAKGLLSRTSSPKQQKILSDLLQNLEDNSDLEDRRDDEDWFRGVDARFKTKSTYMKFNCQSRIRSYLYELYDAAKTIEEVKVKAEFVKTYECMKDMLKSTQYNGCYFDRTEKKPCRLCTQEGWFTCQGLFDEDACSSLHSINPYSSKHHRTAFSQWNLDHRIEKKRAIIPTLLEALKNHRSSDINVDYFYRLFFTRDNLKLVDIACHDKGAHNLQCDDSKIYKKPGKEEKQQGKKKRRRLV